MNPMLPIRFFGPPSVILGALSAVTFLIATSMVGSRPSVAQSSLETVRRSRIVSALEDGRRDEAVRLAESIAADAGSDPRTLQLAADALLRGGKPAAAAKLYDQVIQLRVQAKPYLWQRGIALTLAGRYDEGIEQFELHRTVNPNDVENAAWHFLCVAKADSFEAAEQRLLPAPDDPRPPMAEVMTMLREGNAAVVIDRLKEFDRRSGRGRRAHFYGNLYLAMYSDARGDVDTARRRIGRSRELAEHDYMGDVARVYAETLQADPPADL